MRPVEHRKTADIALEYLAEAIESGEFPPGSYLPSEKDLMSRLDVGRPTIREALQALHRTGLIRISHGKRAEVLSPADGAMSQMSNAMLRLLNSRPNGVTELVEARVLLETGLVRIAARDADQAMLESLAEAKTACEQAINDSNAFVAADMAFHRQIAAMSGNFFIAAASGGLLEWLTHFRRSRSIVSAPGLEKLTIEEHQRIFEAISAKDEQGAVLAMSEHLRRANRRYAELGQERGPSKRPPPARRRASRKP